MTCWIARSVSAFAAALLFFTASTAFAQKQVLYENFFDNTDGITVDASDARHKTFIGLNTDPDAPRIRRTNPPIFQNAEPPFLLMVPWTGTTSVSFDVNVTNRKDIELELRLAASRRGHQFGPFDFQNYFKEGEFFRIYINGQLLPEGLYVGGNPHALRKWFRRFSALTNPDDADNLLTPNFETYLYQIPATLVPAGTQNVTVKFEMHAGWKKGAGIDYIAVRGESTTCADTDGDGVDDCSDVCPNDPNKTTDAGVCGCGNAETDTDGDGAPDCIDLCPEDPAKIDPGSCGCGTTDADSDGDGTLDCDEECDLDPLKLEPGICGCGESDVDTDGDGEADCTDGCPEDAGKIVEGVCGCGVADTDTDGDGTADCNDQCPSDSNKDLPGVCGCGVADLDSDGDGTYDCNDGCPEDIDKVEPGVCGCGTADTDSDGDGLANCLDGCIADPNKTTAGQCGCGVPDTDSDGDGTADCNDGCSADAGKTSPGICGCGTADTDTDGDGTADCNDGCSADAAKTAPGQCGCGVADTDSDGDGTADCNDGCSADAAKTAPGICGCGTADTDSDGDGIADCNDQCPADVAKTEPLLCGCGNAETDSNGDGDVDCLDNGGFDEALTGWLTDDNGSGTVEGTTFASVNWARLVTGSPVMIGQDFITPSAAYVIRFDHLFFTTTGTVDVKLGGTTLGTIAAPATLTGDTETFRVRINGANYPGLLGVNAMLELVLDGPTGSEVLITDVRFELEAQLAECFLGADTIGSDTSTTQGNNGFLAIMGQVGSLPAAMPGFEFSRGSAIPDPNLGLLKELRIIMNFDDPNFSFDVTDMRALEWELWIFKRDAFFTEPTPISSHPDMRRFVIEPTTPVVCGGGSCVPDAPFGTGGGKDHYDVRFDLSAHPVLAESPVMLADDWVVGITARDTAAYSGQFNHNMPGIIASIASGPLSVTATTSPPYVNAGDADQYYNGYLFPPLGLPVDVGTLAMTVTEIVPGGYAAGRSCK